MSFSLTLFHGFSFRSSTVDGFDDHSWLSLQHKVEGDFGTAFQLCQSLQLVGFLSRISWTLYEGFLPAQRGLHSFHAHSQHATQILCGIGSATHSTPDRQYSRTRKYFQHDKLVQAELALRFWRDHQNLFAWAPIPFFVRRAD